jgi:hypothetical protein
VLRSLGELGMSLGQGAGGPTIFDVSSGAASQGDKFIDAYAMINTRMQQAAKKKEQTPPPIFTREQIDLYVRTTERVKKLVERELGVSGLHLASPSFFSRITSAPARTPHDEYFHRHVDKVQYGSFAYTALLYLSTQDDEFTGGEFAFIDGIDEQASSGEHEVDALVRPVKGRLSLFTSGSENVHYVRPVLSGVRRALTIAFTCDASKSVEKTLMAKARNMLLARDKLWPAESKDDATGEQDGDKDAVAEDPAAGIQLKPPHPGAGQHAQTEATGASEGIQLRGNAPLKARDPAVAAELLARKMDEYLKRKHEQAGVEIPAAEKEEGPITAVS